LYEETNSISLSMADEEKTIQTNDEGKEKERVTFIKDLLIRRVPQILGIYLGTSWAIIEFLDWLIDRYSISPNIPDVGLTVLASMVPTVLLLAYFHGSPGKDRWTKIEKIGIPTNIVLAIILIVFLFKGTDLRAMTEHVTLTDEFGEKIEKVVVRNKYRKKIFIFNFENLTGNKALDYLQFGIPVMCEYDLSQDLFLTPELSIVLYPQMVEAGYESKVGMPLTFMRSLAGERHMDYFIYGFIKNVNDTLNLETKIYNTDNSKLISDFTISETSPFKLVDQLSVRIKDALDLPEHHINETVDLPISEILSGSEKAIKYYVSFLENSLSNDNQENSHFLESAIKEDSSFALAYLELSMEQYNMLRHSEATNTLNAVMDLLYKLTDRHKFTSKYIYYVLSNEPDKVMTILKMWTELYPDDIFAHSIAAQRYAVRGMIEEAIGEFKEILRIDPEQYNYLITLGNYYLDLGILDSSLSYYKKYAEIFPQEAISYRNLGVYYRYVCQWDQAKENYNKALLMAHRTEEVGIKVDIANIELITGNFNKAFKNYTESLKSSPTVQDSARVFNALVRYYSTLGQFKKSKNAFEEKLKYYERILSKKDFLVHRVFNLDPYIKCGNIDQAIEILEAIEKELEPPLTNLINFGYLKVYSEIGEIEKARKEIPMAEELIKDFGEELLMANINYAQGRIYEAEGKYEQALEYYHESLNQLPSSIETYIDIARCYRLLENYSEAKDMILHGLKHRPFYPTMNYEATLIFLAEGNKGSALEYLNRAVDIWKDADMEYEKARNAKDLLLSLN